jgi:hypothetical protein
MIKERFRVQGSKVPSFAFGATEGRQGLNRGLKYKNPTSKNKKWGFIFINVGGFMADNRAFILDVFQETFALKIAFFIHLRFIATFWAPDIVPFRFNCYFLKPAMLFADKLINRHAILLNKNIISETSPLICISAKRWDCFSFFGRLER